MVTKQRGDATGDWFHIESYADTPSQNTCRAWETRDLLTLLAREDDEWMAQGGCSNQDMLAAWGLGPDAWMEPAGAHGGWFNPSARELCEACPVKAECLNHALEHGEDVGMWGGLTPNQRHRLLKRRAAEVFA